MTFARRFWLHELPLLKLSNKSPKVTKNLNPSSITKRQDQSTKEADFTLLFWACDSPSLCKETEKDQIADANTTVNIVIVYIGIHSLIFSSLHIGDSSKVRPDHLLTWHTETLFKDLWSTRILYRLKAMQAPGPNTTKNDRRKLNGTNLFPRNSKPSGISPIYYWDQKVSLT